MVRILIEDLPPIDNLSPEELEKLFGAGRPSFQPSIEQLEGRELTTADIKAVLTGGVLNIQVGHKAGTPTDDAIAIRRTADNQIQVFSGLRDGQMVQQFKGNEVNKIDLQTVGTNDHLKVDLTGLGRLNRDAFFTNLGKEGNLVRYTNFEGNEINMVGNPAAERAMAGSPATQRSSAFRTQGNQILDQNGMPYRISAVNWTGFETDNFAPHGLWNNDGKGGGGGLNYKQTMDQMKKLGFNTIRLPVSSDTLTGTPKAWSIDYKLNPDLFKAPPSEQNGYAGTPLTTMEVLDKVIAYAEKIGLNIILDHHQSKAGEDNRRKEELWYVPGDSKYTHQAWIDFWKTMAQRYKSSKAVIGADLHNEPHGAAGWGNGDPKTDWRKAAEEGGNAIQKITPDWLIIVEGVQYYKGIEGGWGSNLAGVADHPITLDVPNRVVYSAHAYDFFGDGKKPFGDAERDVRFGYIYRKNIAPVWVGEFGLGGNKAWFADMLKYLGAPNPNGNKGMSWAYFGWTPNIADATGVLQKDNWTAANTEVTNQLATVIDRDTPAVKAGWQKINGVDRWVVTTTGSQDFKSRIDVYDRPDGTLITRETTRFDGATVKGVRTDKGWEETTTGSTNFKKRVERFDKPDGKLLYRLTETADKEEAVLRQDGRYEVTWTAVGTTTTDYNKVVEVRNQLDDSYTLYSRDIYYKDGRWTHGEGALQMPAQSGPWVWTEYGRPVNEVLAPNKQEAERIIKQKYDAWKKSFLRDGGSGTLRVARPESNDDTVSEGQGYGMLLAVQNNDRDTFNKLWQFAKNKFNGNGLMSWHIDGRTGLPVAGEAGSDRAATDADEDMALALILAHQKWGSTPEFNYAEDARTLLGNIMKWEVEDGSFVLKPGDAFGGSSQTNPSYFAPAYYKIFAQFTQDNRWTLVANKCYEILKQVADPKTGLVPDWVKWDDGIKAWRAVRADDTGPDGKPLNRGNQVYGYDAIRTPWRIALDAAWNRDPRAIEYLDKVNAFFKAQGARGIKDKYNLDGTDPGGTYHNAAGVSMAATAAIVDSDVAYRQSFWNETRDVKTENVYYNESLRLLSMMLTGGQFAKPALG